MPIFEPVFKQETLGTAEDQMAQQSALYRQSLMDQLNGVTPSWANPGGDYGAGMSNEGIQSMIDQWRTAAQPVQNPYNQMAFDSLHGMGNPAGVNWNGFGMAQWDMVNRIQNGQSSYNPTTGVGYNLGGTGSQPQPAQSAYTSQSYGQQGGAYNANQKSQAPQHGGLSGNSPVRSRTARQTRFPSYGSFR